MVQLVNIRSSSYIKVEQWVSSIPDMEEVVEEEEEIGMEGRNALEEPGNEDTGEDDQNQIKQQIGSEYRRRLLHRDTAASHRSDISLLSSVESLLMSRQCDPEEVLLSLGFGGSETLAKIPLRFLSHKSQAKGVSIGQFLKKEDDTICRRASGFFGYRGLIGSNSRRPSEIVGKILETLKDQERQEIHSPENLGGYYSILTNSAIPARFRLMDPKRSTFQSVVDQLTRHRLSGGQQKDTKTTFKSIAQSVITEEKIKEQRAKDNETIQDITPKEKSLESRESSQSLLSSVSVDSDWSEDEAEKTFGAMENSKTTNKDNKLSSVRYSKDIGMATLLYSRENSEIE